MKDLRILTLLGVFALTLFTYSCGDDDDPAPVPGAPNLSFSSADPDWLTDDADLLIGETFAVGLNGTAGDAAMTNITVLEDGSQIDDDRITVNGDPDFGNPYALVGTTQQNFFEIEFEIEPHDELETRTYEFVLRDANGEEDRLEIDITITGSPLSTTTGEIVNNADGPNLGGYDLDGLQTVSSNAGSADIVDRGIDLSQPVNTNWYRQWTNNNGASELRYARGGLNFNDVTVSEELVDEWGQAGSSFSISNALNEGDLILARKGGDYYLIRIDDVVETSGNNEDFVQFSIKHE